MGVLGALIHFWSQPLVAIWKTTSLSTVRLLWLHFSVLEAAAWWHHKSYVILYKQFMLEIVNEKFPWILELTENHLTSTKIMLLCPQLRWKTIFNRWALLCLYSTSNHNYCFSQDPFDAELQRVPLPWILAVSQQRRRGAGPHSGWGRHHQTCPLEHPGTRVLLWGENWGCTMWTNNTTLTIQVKCSQQ